MDHRYFQATFATTVTVTENNKPGHRRFIREKKSIDDRAICEPLSSKLVAINDHCSGVNSIVVSERFDGFETSKFICASDRIN